MQNIQKAVKYYKYVPINFILLLCIFGDNVIIDFRLFHYQRKEKKGTQPV